MALPDFEMRAPTTTRGNLDNVISGVIAMVSSSANVTGRSRTCRRRMASGIRGPSAARAKMNTVSCGATLPASSLASTTVPLTTALGMGAAAAAGAGC
ncbi:hypothetical protein D3C83_83880 [compost metagenome]